MPVALPHLIPPTRKQEIKTLKAEMIDSKKECSLCQGGGLRASFTRVKSGDSAINCSEHHGKRRKVKVMRSFNPFANESFNPLQKASTFNPGKVNP